MEPFAAWPDGEVYATVHSAAWLLTRPPFRGVKPASLRAFSASATGLPATLGMVRMSPRTTFSPGFLKSFCSMPSLASSMICRHSGAAIVPPKTCPAQMPPMQTPSMLFSVIGVPTQTAVESCGV